MPLPGFRHLPSYFEPAAQRRLLAAVLRVISAGPLYTPRMPKTGRPMSVRMTNCGALGWVTDQARGYRYQAEHPETGRAWPSIPLELMELWQAVAPTPALPEACLVNYYSADAKLGLHQDMDEDDRSAPVVSVSLGDDAWFRVGGLSRKDPTERLLLRSGDVVVLGGAARMAFHGVDRILPGTSDLLAGSGLDGGSGGPSATPLLDGLIAPRAAGGRINLTLRRVSAIAPAIGN